MHPFLCIAPRRSAQRRWMNKSRSSARRWKRDQIITELMGYAQLAEGKVKAGKVAEELDAALQEVFPAGVETRLKSTRITTRAGLVDATAARTLRRAGLTSCKMPRSHGVAGAISTSAYLRAEQATWCHSDRRHLPDIPPDKIQNLSRPTSPPGTIGSGAGDRQA